MENGDCNVPLRAFSAEELVKATNNFESHRIVYEDDFCSMYKGSFQKFPILIKKYGKEGGFWPTEDISSYATNDMTITSEVSNHTNILKLIGCCVEFQFPSLVYEYGGGGIELLSHVLHEKDRSKEKIASLSWKTRLSIASDIASAVAHLHTAFSSPIVHRNLQPKSFIIDQGVAKMLDFSFSIRIPKGETQVQDIVLGTYGYAEPEYVATGIITVKTDVYAFGMIMLELLTGKKTLDNVRGGSRNHLDNLVREHVEKGKLNQIVDPGVLGEGGVEEGQFQLFAALAFRCIGAKREDRPEMISVAEELGRIRTSVNLI